MTLVGAPSAPLPAVATPRSLAAAVLVPLATIVVILALAILPLLTPVEARGYLRATSPKAAQAASFSFSAASDWPRRNKASGALADVSYLLVTPRNDCAASRYFWRWK